MRNLTLTLLVATAALALGGAAGAQSAPAAQPEVTRAAVEQRSAQAFDRLDANRDGKLDRADRAAREAERRKARFDRIDTNHDGQVSYEEFTAMRAAFGGPRHERFGRRGEHRMGPNRFAHGFGHLGMIRRADADKDGAITRAEFQGAALQPFDRLDANHDGTVTRDEAKAARDNMRQRWQARREDRAS